MTPPTSQGTYPRSRGKTSIVQGTTRYTGDSSPLTRGKPGDELSDLRPRGPSPLTRGKHSLAAPNAPPGGLIPAHTGKTSGRSTSTGTPTAHPRSRGENSIPFITRIMDGGSSPLTRGKRLSCRRASWRGGLIPAHAGKTRKVRQDAPKRRAHPRSRGENVIVSVLADTKRGSSPLTRGKRPASAPTPTAAGLIPAHAGKTAAPPPPISTPTAHPRSRGENHTRPVSVAEMERLIPAHAGKTRRSTQVPAGRVRLIPAHAGKTAYR